MTPNNQTQYKQGMERGVHKKMQERTEHDFLILLTGGKGIPEPTTYPPKSKLWTGIVNIDARA